MFVVDHDDAHRPSKQTSVHYRAGLFDYGRGQAHREVGHYQS